MFSMFQWLRFRPQGSGLRVEVLGSRPLVSWQPREGSSQETLL